MSWFPQVGDTVGRYTITDVLGHGGMGVVFVAVAPDLARPVALKVLAPQAAVDPRLRERFAREAATLARLDSPHIVYILEYGEQNGCPYLVTQLVPGGDLRHHLDEHGPLPPRQAADVMEQVAAGLEEAHSHGVVHRDLKSANILLRTLPSGEFHAYLCDFGIARADTFETTSASGVVGTLEYLAPERQSGAPASVVSDVYSLGCLLWAAVTGAPPYRGSEVDVALAHLRAPVPQLPAGDPVSRRTNAIVARAMAKKPGDRYPSAHEMRKDLVALAALAAEQEERSAASTAPPGWRRRPASLALAGVVVTAVVVGTTAWLVRENGNDPSGLRASPPDPGSSQARSSAPSARPRRCWDGQIVEAVAACSTPSGRQGLLWVYPSFKDDRATCRPVRKPLSPRKLLVYFCPFDTENPNGGIRYSEWSSASAAHEIMTTDFYWPEKDVERDGYTWSLWVREDRDEKGWFSTGVAYRDWPFSAEVVSNTKGGAIEACDFIELRSPITFHAVKGLCGSST